MLNQDQIAKYKLQVLYFEISCQRLDELKLERLKIITKVVSITAFGIISILMHKKDLLTSKFCNDHVVSHIVISVIVLLFFGWISRAIFNITKIFNNISKEHAIRNELKSEIELLINSDPLFKEEYKIYHRYRRLL